ncbi:putative baseplate assembly protein [Sorangium sp. So ce429]
MSAPIDYTNIGYDALREAMLALARESLPEWTDLSENDLGVLLVELFAYASDITLYYQTRIASNLLPETSDDPGALVQLLRLLGYEMRPPAPSTVDLRVAVDATERLPLTIPAGTRFVTTTGGSREIAFETVRDIDVTADRVTPPDARNLVSFYPVPVVQGTTVRDEPVQVANGQPNQTYPLRQKPVIAGSIAVTVREPGGDARWYEVESLARSGPTDRSFAVQRDALGGATLVFGDGTNGLIPPAGSIARPVTIAAEYRVGGGPEGNVAASSQFRVTSAGMSSVLRNVVNPQAAAGGTAGEDIERARRAAPRLLRTQERAVTLDDYVDLALQVPGVGKARAVPVSWNKVLLYVAPSGQVAEPSELLKQEILAFFEPRRMASVHIDVTGPVPADIYLRVTVRAEPYFFKSDVQAAIERAVASYFAFEAVSFGQAIYISRIYDLIQSLPQVVSLNVTQFSRDPAAAVEGDGVIELAPYELPRVGSPPIAVEVLGGLAR